MTTYLATPDPGDLMTLAVRDKSPVAEDIVRFELAHPQGCEPPAFSAGSMCWSRRRKATRGGIRCATRPASAIVT